MIVFVSQASGAFYRKVLKPILFKRQPDEVHARLLVFCAAMQRLWVIRVIMKRMWAYKNPAYLRQTLMGLQFENPVGLSAGFDKNITLAPTMQALGFGLMEGGSLTRQQ